MASLTTSRPRSIAVPLAAALLAACEPTFERSGALSVGAEEFLPAACHVLSCGTGIELRDEDGASLELRLPPATLKAFRSLSGTPEVAARTGPGRPPVELGPCGSLTLTGQGYHGQGKRAARGRLELDCPGPPAVRGELSFVGCF